MTITQLLATGELILIYVGILTILLSLISLARNVRKQRRIDAIRLTLELGLTLKNEETTEMLYQFCKDNRDIGIVTNDNTLPNKDKSNKYKGK